MSATDIPLHDPSQWPVRMKPAEVWTVMRWSRRTFYARLAEHRFPPSDDGLTWSRDVVKRYAEGGVKEFERRAAARSTK